MNFEKESSGQSSIENTVLEPIQIVSNPNPSISGMQSSMSALMQSYGTLKCPTLDQQKEVVDILTANLQSMVVSIKHQRRHHQPHQQQQWQMITENHTMKPQQVLQNPDPSIADMQSPTLELKQLLETLKSPAVDQQQRVLDILKESPQLMTAFIKQRTAIQQHKLALQQQQWQMLLNESTMAENHAMRLQKVSLNPDPAVAGMQRHTPASNQLLEISQSPASAQQQQQVVPILKANPQLMAVNVSQVTQQHGIDLQTHKLFLQQHQRFMQQFQQQLRLYQQELQDHRQQRQRRVLQRRQRRQMLLQHNITGYSTMRPHQVPIADVQRPTEEWQQMLETLNALNLK